MNLEDYGDSKTLLAECKEKEALINNYQFGLNMMEERNWRPAAEAFSKCGDYENSQKYAAKCARFARQSRSPDGSFTIMHTLMSGLSSFFFSLMLLSPVTTRIVPLPGSIAICLQIAYAVICVLRNKYKTASHMFKSGLLLIAISIGIITVAPASVSSEITSIALVPLAILFLFI